MLKKLLKYDMRAVSGLWWIGAVISVAAAVVGAFLIRFFTYVNQLEEPNVILSMASILGALVAIFCILAIFLAFVFTVVLVFVRFYKNFFTDEGYLTFTLPVKRSTLLFSKMVNATVWFSAHFGVIVLSVLLFVLLVWPPEADGFFINFAVFKNIGEWFVREWDRLGAWMIVYDLVAFLLLFVFLQIYIVLFHFCITVGAMLAKKAKVILAIGIYYAFSWILATVGQFCVVIFAVFMADGMMTLMENATQNQTHAVYTLAALAFTAVLASVVAVLYSVTQYLLDRKLNLA